MRTTPELAKLITQIRSTRSPLARLRLLARGWQAVRSLSREERIQVARFMGLHGFEELLERLGRGGAVEAEEIHGLLAAAEDLEPSKVSEVLRSLRQPEQRAELVRRAAASLADRLSHDQGAAKPAPVRAPSPPVKRAAPSRPKPPQSPAPAEAPAPAASAAPAPSSETRPIQASRAPRPAPVPPPARAALPAGSPAEGREAGDDRTAGDLHPVPAHVPAAPSPRSSAGTERVLEGIRSASSIVARFRILRRSLSPESGLEGDRLDAILAAFPAGWGRRRALASILRAGLPRSFDAAVAAIEGLERPADRLWCIRALAEGRRLRDAERKRVVEVPMPASQRRRLPALLKV